MTRSRLPLIITAFFSVLVALVSYRFVLLGMSVAFPGMLSHLDQRWLAFVLHVTASPIALAIGVFQFFPGYRQRRPALHRLSGRIYAFSVLVGGLSGLWLAFGTNGPVAGAGFGLLSVVWMVVTALAVRAAMARRIADHRHWMILSFALTLAGVTLRLYLAGFTLLGFSYPEASIYLAWICWVPNVVIAYWWLRREAQQKVTA